MKNKQIENINNNAIDSIVAPNKTLEILFIASCAIIAIGMVLSSFYYGLSGDEAYANGMGKAAWDYISSFGANRRIFDLPDNINRDGVLTYYGNIFDIICIWINKISPWDEFTTRHIVNAFSGFLGIYFSAKIVKKYWGTTPAIYCLWLMVFYPFFFGHAMNNPKDAPLASFFIMGVYYLLNFFTNLANLKVMDYVWLILAIILAIDVRVAGILLIAYIPVFAFLHYKHTLQVIKDKGMIKVLTSFGIVAVVSYLGCSIFWPYAMQNPLSNPLEALAFLSDFKVSLGQVWEGIKIPSTDLPKDYLIRSIFITSPWVFVVGIIILAIGILIKGKEIAHKNILLCVAFAGLFPLFYIMYKGSNTYHLWRHVLFVFPPLAILSSVGWYSLSKLIPNAKAVIISSVVFGLFLLEPIIFYAQTFPNNICYFNSSVGGTKEAYGNYEIDYYYNSMKACVDYVTKNAVANAKDTIKVTTNAEHLLKEYYKEKNYKAKTSYSRYYERSKNDWDYGIFHISLIPLEMIQDGSWATDPNVVYTSKVLDKPLCIVIKRPSKEDMNVYKYIDEKNYAASYQSAVKYLEKDPTNVFILDIKKRLEEAVQQQPQ